VEQGAPVSAASQKDRLAQLVARASRLRGLRNLSDDELLEFGRLYRRVAAELSYARTHGVDVAELERLNWLVGRAYGLLYVSGPGGWSGAKRFFREELPQTLRRHGRLIALSAAVLLGAALVGALIELLRPDFLELISPDTAGAVEELAARHQGGQNWLPADFRPVASSLIMTNNIQVSFLAFSTGILLCLPTIYVIAFNGLTLGAIATGISRTPAGVYFWSFVAPHGVIELPSIVIAAAAGMLLGLAVIEPGEHSRVDALCLAGRQAAVMMMGVTAFLVVAGFVEGLFSPAVAPPVVKFAAAWALAAGFWYYILAVGRDSGSATGAPAP
jgi:uncharacterized membrane protein SpoIIM required for sporulation